MKLRGPKETKMVGQADTSSTQQFHFPTALPPAPLSSGLNSTFSYDGACIGYMLCVVNTIISLAAAVGKSYFASESSSVRQPNASQVYIYIVISIVMI